MNPRPSATDAQRNIALGPPQADPRKEAVNLGPTQGRSSQMRKTPTRVLVVATSLLVVAASVLAVTASAQSGARANHRARPFHLTKTCPPSQYQGQIGGYCTVTSSNVAAITVGTKIFYAQAAGPTSLDSDVILYAGPATPRPAIAHSTLRSARALHALRWDRDARRHPCSRRCLVSERIRLGLGRDYRFREDD